MQLTLARREHRQRTQTLAPVPRDLKIQPGLIIVTTLSKSPLSTAKSPLEIQAVRTFRLEKNRLIEVKA